MKQRVRRQRWVALVLVLWLVSLCLGGCGTTGQRAHAGPRGDGLASWYGPGFHGRRTASGEVFDMHAMTAAHRSLAMGTYVRVTNLQNNRTTVVRINDRGPFKKGRVIDLSYQAAQQLGMVEAGVVPVRLEVARSPVAAAR